MRILVTTLLIALVPAMLARPAEAQSAKGTYIDACASYAAEHSAALRDPGDVKKWNASAAFAKACIETYPMAQNVCQTSLDEAESYEKAATMYSSRHDTNSALLTKLQWAGAISGWGDVKVNCSGDVQELARQKIQSLAHHLGI